MEEVGQGQYNHLSSSTSDGQRINLNDIYLFNIQLSKWPHKYGRNIAINILVEILEIRFNKKDISIFISTLIIFLSLLQIQQNIRK